MWSQPKTVGQCAPPPQKVASPKGPPSRTTQKNTRLQTSDPTPPHREGAGRAAFPTEELTPGPHRARGQGENLRALASPGHPGQARSAANLRRLLRDSSLVAAHDDATHGVQDAYSLRCHPQVLGAGRDTLEFASGVAERELAALMR